MDNSKSIREDTNLHEALLQISKAINSSLELPDILGQVVQYTCSLIGCDHASIVLWNSRLGLFEVGASTTKIGSTVPYRVRSTGGASRWILDHKKPLIVPDVNQDPFTANPMIRETKIRAYVGVPVQHSTEVVGVLYALSKQVYTFENDEIVRMQELANMTAIAIQNSWLVRSLRELNDFKNAMLRMTVHDLGNPLQVAQGYLEILIDDLGPLQSNQLEWLNNIQQAHIRMKNLTLGILKYEQLSAKSEIEYNSIDLNAIVEESASSFNELATQKSQHLTLLLFTEPLIVKGNALLLSEAVSNLISNAIKYTPKGGHITIRSGKSNQGIFVSVRDTGPGIDPTEQIKLFQPFIRLSSAENKEGTGLGLSLVKLIVELHRGQVSAQSSLGEGSIFHIYLPHEKKTASDCFAHDSRRSGKSVN